VAIAQFLELQRRMLRITFQQRELFIGSGANAWRKGTMVLPRNPRWRGGSLRDRLEGSGVSGFVVGQSAINPVVDASGVKIGFEPRVDGLGVAVVEPDV
jgi:hypothetical protein